MLLGIETKLPTEHRDGNPPRSRAVTWGGELAAMQQQGAGSGMSPEAAAFHAASATAGTDAAQLAQSRHPSRSQQPLEGFGVAAELGATYAAKGRQQGQQGQSFGMAAELAGTAGSMKAHAMAGGGDVQPGQQPSTEALALAALTLRCAKLRNPKSERKEGRRNGFGKRYEVACPEAWVGAAAKRRCTGAGGPDSEVR